MLYRYNAAAGNSTAQAAIIKALLQDVTMLQGQLNGSSTAFKAAYMAANEFVTGNGGVAGLERATNALLGRCGNVNATLTVLNDTLRWVGGEWGAAVRARCGPGFTRLRALPPDVHRAAQANMSKCPTSNTTCASYWAGVINSTTAKLRAEEELGVLCAGPQGQLLAQLHNTGNAMCVGVNRATPCSVRVCVLHRRPLCADSPCRRSRLPLHAGPRDQGVGLAFGTAFELMQGTSSNVAGNAGMLMRQLSGSIGINFFTNALLRTMAKGCGDFFGVTYAFATNACQTLCPH